MIRREDEDWSAKDESRDDERERENGSDSLDELRKEGDVMGDEVRLPERDGRGNDRTREREERD